MGNFTFAGAALYGKLQGYCAMGFLWRVCRRVMGFSIFGLRGVTLMVSWGLLGDSFQLYSY